VGVLRGKSETMAEEIAISLKNVSKCYKRYPHPVDRLKEILLPGKSRAEEFWALRDIDLEIPKGHTLGIIGQNGSGKSTLLQIIVGTLTPTTGAVTVNGRISALLELGSGFNPEFTGRQNVFFNGRLLGMTQEELENKFDEIASFADIGEFIDQPVKTYSSGMFVRLAFAVATHVNPEILIIDEALSVGDILFQRKCFRKIEQFYQDGKTILFVSHDLTSILQLCDRAILLDKSLMISQGEPRQVALAYKSLIAQREADQNTHLASFQQKYEEKNDNQIGESRIGFGGAEVISVEVVNSQGTTTQTVEWADIITVRIAIYFYREVARPFVGFAIKDLKGLPIIGTNTFHSKKDLAPTLAKSMVVIEFSWQCYMSPGNYTVSAGVAELGDHSITQLDRRFDMLPLAVVGNPPSLGFFALPINIECNVLDNSQNIVSDYQINASSISSS